MSLSANNVQFCADIHQSNYDTLKVHFENIENENIKKCFLTVLEQYHNLHDYDVSLTQTHLKSSTMQAQPEIRLKKIFGGVDAYRIKLGFYIRDSEQRRVSELPDEVLIGWFAHELGHLVDYENHSTFGMLIYGIRYVFSKKFKREAEHQADRIAIENGFVQEIIATKRYILENDFLAKNYQDKIRKYYMSIADVELCIEDESPLEAPKVEL